MIVDGVVHIRRAPGEVFDFLADTGRWADVDEALVGNSVSGRVALGTRCTMQHRRPGVKVTTSFEVTAFEPPKTFDITITGLGHELRETVRLDAADEGTLLRRGGRRLGPRTLGFVAAPPTTRRLDDVAADVEAGLGPCGLGD